MSVIQKIQDKYAKLMAMIIALALIIFVVMLAFENGGSLFRGGNSSVIGKVNGQSIDREDFIRKTDQEEDYMKSQGYPAGAALRQQAMDQAWNREIQRVIMSSETEKLGMQIGKKELGDILYGPNAPQDLKQQFTDASGVFNAQQAKAQVDQMLKRGTPEQKAQFNAYVDNLEAARMNEKYNSLLTNSTNFPKWQIEKQTADNSQMAQISLVREFYTSVPDSSVKVSDKEVGDYIEKHKDDFKQEESRGISYVAFSALPVAADSAAAREKLLAMRPQFDSAKDVKQFLESQGIQTFFDGYINGFKIQVPSKDSIFKTPVGSIYGPYLDGAAYSLAKMIGIRTQPDTVKVRHILIGTVQRDPQSGQMIPIRDSSSARKLADSIQRVIAAGSNFDTLLARFSDDQGSKDKGGVYDQVTAGRMTPAFDDFIFNHPVGAKGVVETEFGYHYIEILSQKGSSPAYKIAYLSQPIEASPETDQAANSDANLFAGDSRDQKLFDANADKLRAKGINKLFASNILPNAADVQGLGSSRNFVKDIYQAKLGEVLQPERVGDNYVVAIVTEINEKGTQSVAKARMMVEPLLRNHKKAEVLANKLGKSVTSLEAASTAWGGKPIETADSLRMDGSRSVVVANEPKVVGAAFNPANKGKVVPQVIEGTGAVFAIRVDNVSATAVTDANVADQRKAKYQEAKMRGAYGAQAVIQTLVEAADIKDNRSKFF
jgi:peptidyl-prolyl cis-trans isomerase D